MNKEYLEAFKVLDYHNDLKKYWGKEFDIVEQALQRLEAIDNAKPSEALEKLEMLSDCAEAMKEAPSSNWIEYANSEAELDYKLWRAYEDLKQYILKAQEQEKQLGCPLEVRLQVDCDAIVYDEDGYEYNVDYVYKNNFICHNGQCDDFGCDYEFTFNWNDYKNTWWLKKDKSE